jgi:hypothetical protein
MVIFAYLTDANWRLMVIMALLILFYCLVKFSRLNFDAKNKFEDVIE